MDERGLFAIGYSCVEAGGVGGWGAVWGERGGTLPLT